MAPEIRHGHIFSAEKGFTLIEVLIAMLIATVALLALAMMQGTAIQGNSYSNKLTRATVLAQAKLEQLNSALLSPNDVRDTKLRAGAEKTEEVLDEDGNPTPFTLTWRVQPNTTFSRKIGVVVTWTSNEADGEPGRIHKVELSTVTRGIFL